MSKTKSRVIKFTALIREPCSRTMTRLRRRSGAWRDSVSLPKHTTVENDVDGRHHRSVARLGGQPCSNVAQELVTLIERQCLGMPLHQR